MVMAAKKATTHSKNYEKVKNFYDEGLWDTEKVRNAVTNPKSNPWITEEEFEEITGESYQ
jgi:hypothetical protein